jgi:hypothetical protein
MSCTFKEEYKRRGTHQDDPCFRAQRTRRPSASTACPTAIRPWYNLIPILIAPLAANIDPAKLSTRITQDMLPFPAERLRIRIFLIVTAIISEKNSGFLSFAT